MPQVEVKGQKMYIPQEGMSAFTKDHPEANIHYKIGSDTLSIPIKSSQAFLKDYPQAKTIGDNISGVLRAPKQNFGIVPSIKMDQPEETTISKTEIVQPEAKQEPIQIPSLVQPEVITKPDPTTGAFTPEIAAGMRGEVGNQFPVQHDDPSVLDWAKDTAIKTGAGIVNMGVQLDGIKNKVIRKAIEYSPDAIRPFVAAMTSKDYTPDVEAAGKAYVEELNKSADTYKGKTITDLHKKGDYIGLAGKVTQDAISSLPMITMALMAPEVGLPMIGATTANEKYDSLAGRKDMSENEKVTNAVTSGVISAVTLWAMGASSKYLGSITESVGKVGAEQTTAALKTGLSRWVTDTYLKAGILSEGAMMGAQSVVAKIADNSVDYATNATDTFNPMKGTGEALISGAATGLAFGGLGELMKIPAVKEAKKNFDTSESGLISVLVEKGLTDAEVTGVLRTIKNVDPTLRPDLVNKILEKIPEKNTEIVDFNSGETNQNVSLKSTPLQSSIENYFGALDNLKQTSSKYYFDSEKEKQQFNNEITKAGENAQSGTRNEYANKFGIDEVSAEKAKAEQQLVDLSNKTTGTIQTVKLKDDSEIQIANGTPIFKEDGTFDAEKTGIITHNPKDENGNPVLNEDGTPKILVVDPNSIMSLVSETPVQEAQAEAGSQIDQAVISNQIDEFYPKDVEDYEVDGTPWRISVNPETNSLTKQELEINGDITYEVNDPINITDEEYSHMSGKSIPNQSREDHIVEVNDMVQDGGSTTEPAPAYPTDKNGNVDFKAMSDEQIFNHTKETKGEDAAHSLIGRQITRLQGQIQDNTRATVKHNEETNKLLAKAKTMQDEVAIQAKQDAKEVSLKEEYTALNSKLGELQSLLPKVEVPAPVETPKVVTTRPEILQLQKEQAQSNLAVSEPLTPNLDTSSEVLQPNVDTSNEVQETPVVDQTPMAKPKETQFQKRAKALGEYIDMRDYILRIIAGGQKIKWKDGLESEFRGSNAERLQRRNYIDETNGLTPTELAHQIWNDYGENGNNGEIPGVYNMSDGEILDEVHEVLRTVKSNSDALSQAEERRTIGTYDPAPEEAQIIDAFDDEMFAAVLGITNFTPEQITTLNEQLSGWSEYIQYEQNSINPGATPTSESNSPEGNAVSEEGSRTEEMKFNGAIVLKKFRDLMSNKPVIVYRGLSKSGKNFYKGDKELDYTYYTLDKSTAVKYGTVGEYVFNENGDNSIKIYSGSLFEKFGNLDASIEDSKIREELRKEGYSAVVGKRHELIVLDKSIIKPTERKGIKESSSISTEGSIDSKITGQEPNLNPTDGQKEAGNYKLAHITISGMDISVENPVGSLREGKDEDGKAWSHEMKSHYGYFKGTVGRDGDHIDVFTKSNTPEDYNGKVFVIDQVYSNGPKSGLFDESKVMLGYDTAKEAEQAYMENYDKDWNGLSDMTEVSVDDFKKWLYDGAKQTKPFADYKETPQPLRQVTESLIKNGYIVAYEGKQYTINGITSDGKFVDLYEGDNMIHEDIPVESVSNLETSQQSNETKLSETNNEQPNNQKIAKTENVESLPKSEPSEKVGEQKSTKLLDTLTGGEFSKTKAIETANRVIKELNIKSEVKVVTGKRAVIDFLEEQGLTGHELIDHANFIRLNEVVALNYDGKIVINTEHAKDEATITKALLHESVHEATSQSFTNAELAEIYDNNEDLIHSVIPSSYHGKTKAEQASEWISIEADALTSRYSPSQIAGGIKDLPLPKEVIQSLNKLYGNDNHFTRKNKVPGSSNEGNSPEVRKTAKDSKEPGLSNTNSTTGTSKAERLAAAKAKVNALLDKQNPVEFMTAYGRGKTSIEKNIFIDDSVLDTEYIPKEYKHEKAISISDAGSTIHRPTDTDLWEEAYKIVPTEGSAIFNSKNIHIAIYKEAGSYVNDIKELKKSQIKFIQSDNGGPVIDKKLAKNFLNDYNFELNHFAAILVNAKSRCTEAAQKSINETLEQIEYAKKYYSDLVSGKDVWRTADTPMFMAFDSELFQAGVEMTQILLEDGAIPFDQYSAEMIEATGERIKPFLKMFYDGSRHAVPVEIKKGMTSSEKVDKFDIEKFDVNKYKELTQNKNNESKSDVSLSGDKKAFVSAIKEKLGVDKLNIVSIRKIASENGFGEIKDTTLQEYVELALIEKGKDIISQNISSEEKYQQVVDLYNSQPTISMRSSERIEKQQYSTPLPISFMAGEFVNAINPASVLEPSAGNGMMVFNVDSKKVIANEIDNVRLENLREQPFKEVTDQDGTLQFNIDPVDAVVTNPPFGKSDARDYEGYKIAGLDEQMVVNALSSMKDSGRASIIIGGHTKYKENGTLAGEKAFLNYLYDKYNVTDIINIDGSLYSKQGTSFPVRLIIINGRRTGFEALQRRYAPLKQNANSESIKTFDELYTRVKDHEKNLLHTIAPLESNNGTIPTNGNGTTVQNGNTSSNKPIGGSGGQSGTSSTGPSKNGRPSNKPAKPIGSIDAGGSDIQSTERGGESTASGSTGGNTRRISTKDAEQFLDRSNVRPEPLKVDLESEKTIYPARSKSDPIGSVVPTNGAQTLNDILHKFKDIDSYVQTKLGYESKEELFSALAAEQVDSVAMAIYQIENGKALIIGDMTGVGKGRQAAAIIRYAALSGKKPIFVTEKAALFSDIYRDLRDIGSADLIPFIVNSKGKEDPSMTDENGVVIYSPLADSQKKSVLASGKLPSAYDYVVLTYTQLNGNEKKNGLSAKQSFFRNIAVDNVLVLDESHNAGGEGNTGIFMTETLPTTKGVTFLSGTFAKRADNMPIYAMKTSMSDANMSENELITAIQSGGIPLQEIMSKNLTEVGQMIRRERDFTGVNIDWQTMTGMKEMHYKTFDGVIEVFNQLIHFQKDFVDPIIKDLNESLAGVQGSAGTRKGTEALGISNTPFASKTFNLVRQMLFSLKAKEVSAEAIKELKAGRKPVIAIANTMGSFLNEMGSVGDVVDNHDYSLTLMRGLTGLFRYTESDANGDKVHKEIDKEFLGSEGLAKYAELEAKIKKLSSGISISPIDVIKAEITKAGFSVGEMTGRDNELIFNENGSATISKRTNTDKKKLARDFNAGDIDVLILNQSASTGISLHASSKFKDQRQRVMLFAQNQLDVNTEVQMRGRIDRTGQIVRGAYRYIISPIPAEQRMIMMFKAKLKSLDANTTSNQKSKTNEIDVVDFLNKYGDEIVVEYLKENPEINEKMLDPFSLIGKSEEELAKFIKEEDASNKVAGRAALLSVKEQEAFYNEVTEKYITLLNYLNDSGTNDLEITTLPLKAETKAKHIVVQGKNSGNPFSEDSVRETVEVDVLKKPMSIKEVNEEIQKLTEGLTANEYKSSLMKKMGDYMNVQIEETTKKTTEDYSKKEQAFFDKKQSEFEKKVADGELSKGDESTFNQNAETDWNSMVQLHIEQKTSVIRQRANSIMRSFNSLPAGKVMMIPSSLEIGTDTTYTEGMFLGFRMKDKLTPSTITAVFAPLDSRRRIDVPLSKVSFIQAAYATTMQNVRSIRANAENWDSMIPTKTRRTAYIVTGNILQAYGKDGMKGQLVSYSTIDGEIKQGILLNEKYKASEQTMRVQVINKIDDIRNGRILSDLSNGVTIKQENLGYSISVPLSKARGGKYFLDEGLRDLVYQNDFRQLAGQMVGIVSNNNLEKALQYLSDKFNISIDDSIKEIKPEFMILGERGATSLDKTEEATTRLDNLKVAKEMESTKTPQEIRLSTGWEKGVDGLWRYEVSDGELKKGWENATNLNEAWNDEELFKAYPQLKDVQIGALSPDESENSGTYHDKMVDGKPTICAGGIDEEGLKSVLIHEIQHAIQGLEGFASGGTEFSIASRISKLEELMNNADKLRAVWQNANGKKAEKIALENYQNELSKVDHGEYFKLKKLLPKNLQRDIISSFEGYRSLAGEVESRNVQNRINLTHEARRNTLLSETADIAPEDQVIIYDSLGISESSLKPQPPVFTSSDTILDQARKMRDHEEALQRWQERQIVNLATQNGERLSPATISKLNKDINSVTSKLWEGWADAALPIKEFQKFLEKNGVPISDNDNYYMRLTTVPSRIEYRFNQFKEETMKPFIATLKAIEKNGFTYDDITTYAKLKHGPEYTANILVREYTNKIEAERAKIEDVTGSKDWTTKNQKLDQKMIDFKSTIFDYIEQQGIDYAGRDSIEKRIGETADNFITDFESENGSLVDNFWKQSKEVSHYALDEEVRGGMRTKESAEEIKGMFDYYVPLKGHRDPTAETTWDYSMEHGDFFFSAVKKGKGRTSESDDPFSVMESTVRSAIGAAEQNIQLQSIRRLALKDTTGSMTVSKTWFVKVGEDENGNPEFKVADEVPFEDTDTNETYNDKVAKFEAKMKELKSKGEAYQGGSKRLKLGLWIKPTNEREHEVVVKSNGESYTIRFHTSPRVPQAINGTNMRLYEGTFGAVLDGLGWATRHMAGFKTLWRPAFILVTNPLRDIHAGLNLAFIDEGAKFTANTVLNFRHAQAALLRRSLNKHDLSNKYDKMLNDFMVLGGKTGISKIMELKEIQRSIEKSLKAKINPIEKVFDFYHTVSDVTENQMRFAVYISAIDKGYSSLKATSMAKEATVNFDRKGNGRNGLRELKATYAFINVGFQALDNIYSKSTKNTETKKRALLAIAANVLSGSLLVAAINTAMCALFGWDEDKWLEDFSKRSSFARNANFTIWTPEKLIDIPLGQEFRMYHGLGMDLMMMAHGKVSVMETSINMIKGLSSQLPYNPIESSLQGSWASAMPDFASPLAELAANKSWLGYGIYKQNQDEAAPGYTKIKTNKKGEPYAPEVMIKLSKWLNEGTGGDAAEAGWLGFVNPDIADHLLGGYFAGIYEQPLTLLEATLSDKEGSLIKELTPRAILKNTADIQSRDTGLNEKYYKAKDEAEKDDKLIGRAEKAIELLDKKSPDYEAQKEKYQSKIDKLKTDDLYDIQGTQKTISALEKSLDEISPKEQVKTEKEISELKKNIVKINNGEKVDPKNYTEYISEYYGTVKKVEEYKAKRVLGGEKDAELEKISGKLYASPGKMKSIHSVINLLEKDTKKNPSNREKNEAQIITLIKKL